MTIEDMKAKKAELGYTSEMIADLSGVPLGTVQKIFSGETKSPRYDTVQKLTKLLERKEGLDMYEYTVDTGVTSVGDAALEYGYTEPPKKKSKYADYQIPQKKIIGIANGKFTVPPDEMFYDDEITGLFEDI